MKRNLLSMGMLLMAAAFTFTSCLSDGDDTIVLEDGQYVPPVTPPTTGEGETEVVSSDESATFEGNGFTVTVPNGAVPPTNSGEDGRVAFTVTDGGDLPADLPAGTTAIEGGDIKVEPMNFTFNSPITIDVPLGGRDVDDVALLYYNEATGTWEVIPFSSVNDDGTASVSVIELGYFVLVELDQEQQFAGVHIDSDYLEEGYYYYVTLVPSEYSEGNPVKRIAFAANGDDLYMANIPLGQYDITVSRERRGSFDSAVETTEYKETWEHCDLYEPLVPGSGKYDTYTGWFELELGYDAWYTGRPNGAWGNATATYGTGTFQATLTWVNTNGSITDYDLHLYGPNNLHIYFGHKNEGAYELDRDWISALGNAVENIYTVNDNITPGEYNVRVHHFSGVLGKRYNCRVIMDGVLVKSVTGAITVDNKSDDIYTFTVQ